MPTVETTVALTPVVVIAGAVIVEELLPLPVVAVPASEGAGPKLRL
jgi:hypothetical protein